MISLLKRISKFGVVGIVSTGIHLLVLMSVVHLALLPQGLANLSAFIVAFLFSTSAQQSFTFQDRLAGQKLKNRSLLILFIINSILAYALGSHIQKPFLVMLVFVPSIVNFSLYHFFSGHPDFKR
jgi:putative flippase GtrA